MTAAVTASTMIVASLISIGEKSIGATLTTDEQAHYLARLNSFLDGLPLEKLMVPYLTDEGFSLTASDGVYTIGLGGDFNTARPLEIVKAWIRDSSDADTPMDVISAEAYNSILQKDVDGSYPNYLYYDSGYTYTGQGLTGAGVGLGTIKVYPEPQSGLTLYISSLKPLQQFGGIDVPLQLPPGYQRFIESNFAIEIAGDLPVPATVAKIARESRAAIKSHNKRGVFMRLDAGIVASSQRGSILTGP